MPVIDRYCPSCGAMVHTDCLIEGECLLGCGKVFTPGDMKYLQGGFNDKEWEQEFGRTSQEDDR